jgi:hypothetical protein
MTSPPAPHVVERLERGESFSTREMMSLDRAQVIPELIAALSREDPARRARLGRGAMELLVDLGRPIIPPSEDGPQRPAPIVNDPEVVRFLVSTLNDPDPDVRNYAATILSTQTPGTVLRQNETVLLEALRRHPGTTGAVLMLGRTGSKEARELIESSETMRAVSPDDTEIALARLGDKEAEARVMAAYRSAADVEEKGRQAVRVGYIASREAILALASDMRTSEFYVWRMASRRSLRIHIIEGLNRAFLSEPVFWKPFYKPESDAYYERIEAWLVARTGIRWPHPRPPFLYEEDAPLDPHKH